MRRSILRVGNMLFCRTSANAKGHLRTFTVTLLAANLALFHSGLSRAFVAGAEPLSTPEVSTGTLDGKLTDARSVPLSQATVLLRNLVTGAVAESVTAKNGNCRFVGLGPGEYRLEASVAQVGIGSVDGILISAGHVTRLQAALLMVVAPPKPLPSFSLSTLDPVRTILSEEIAAERAGSVALADRDLSERDLMEREMPEKDVAEAGGTPFGTVMPVHLASKDDPATADNQEARQLSEDTAPLEASLEFETQERMTLGLEAREPEDSEDREKGPSLVQAVTIRSTPDEASTAAQGERSRPSLHEDRLHGSVTYYSREGAWDALNPLTQRVTETAPASGFSTAQFAAEPYSPRNARQAFEAGSGSRLNWKKASWFAAGDMLFRNNPAVATVRHPAKFFAQPTDDALQVLAARLDTSGPSSLAAGATAYSTVLENVSTLLGPVPRSSTRLQALGQTDLQLAERHSVGFDTRFAHIDSPGGARIRTAEMVGSHSFGNSEVTQAQAGARWQAFLTPNLLNSFSAQFHLHILRDIPQAPSAFEQPLIASGWGLLPEIIADSRNGFLLGKPARLGRSNYPDEQRETLQDTLSWVRAKHLFRFGGSYDHLSNAVSSLVNQTGTYSYSNVLNFISDVDSFEKFGLSDIGNPYSGEHNCDETGRVHRSDGVLLGLGYLPCYTWFTQRVGPAKWHFSMNELAGFATDQWQPFHQLTLSASLRGSLQQLPPPIAWVANPDLPSTGRLPTRMLNWAPRVGLAWSPAKGTVVRLGAGMYFGQVGSAALLAALTQTGSPRGDLDLFFKPTDVGAPPFPYAFMSAPPTVVTPGAVMFAEGYRLPEIDQGIVTLEQEFPSHWIVAASGMASLGRRLPTSIDENLDTSQTGQSVTYLVQDSQHTGPLKTPQLTVPLYTYRPKAAYQQLATIESRANSTYEAAEMRVSHSTTRGLSVHARYLYAHATDWNPNESSQIAVSDVLDPRDFRAEYGTSDLDIRHTAGLSLLFDTPWKLRSWAGRWANAWTVGATGQYRSGRPFTMRTGGSIPGFFDDNRKLVEGVAPGMNGSGGDNRVYGVGRNTYRYPATWTGDTRLAKRFVFRREREMEFMAESFNLFNHQNVTRIETTGYTIERGGAAGEFPTLNFETGLTKAGLPSASPEFGKPLDVNATNLYHPREFQIGVRARF